MSKISGVVAAGHEITAEAAQVILGEGGNAFDAALAALFAACVAEPVLASLGGGGFLMAQPAGQDARLYDFFAQTPHRKKPVSEVDFYPIIADFGTAQQEFHIGFGSIATPGTVRGLFLIHRELGSLPLRVIAEPACAAARAGLKLNSFQHYIASIVEPIISSMAAARQLHESAARPGSLAMEGERIVHDELAATIEALVAEGEALFYEGDLASQLLTDCSENGGYLVAEDLAGYQVHTRKPLQVNYHGATLFTNPPPALGGLLIAFTLAILETQHVGTLPFGDSTHLAGLAEAMRLTQEVRGKVAFEPTDRQRNTASILDPLFVAAYADILKDHACCRRGTTQISVADRKGNLASMTLSNGEGSGYVIPGTGIMLNNMLGEEDINPLGFHRWKPDCRIASMMSPSLLFTPNNDIFAIGSGGSNRIRSAILQVISNLVDFDMNLQQAVHQPRIHYESGLLNIESGYPDATVRALESMYPEHKRWDNKNLFFGGAHSVQRDRKGDLTGVGDPRRGGVHRLSGAMRPE